MAADTLLQCDSTIAICSARHTVRQYIHTLSYIVVRLPAPGGPQHVHELHIRHGVIVNDVPLDLWYSQQYSTTLWHVLKSMTLRV